MRIRISTYIDANWCTCHLFWHSQNKHMCNITRLRWAPAPPLRIFSTILVEKCLVAGTYFSQQVVSHQNIMDRSRRVQVTGVILLGKRSSWYAPLRFWFAGFCMQNHLLPLGCIGEQTGCMGKQ